MSIFKSEEPEFGYNTVLIVFGPRVMSTVKEVSGHVIEEARLAGRMQIPAPC